MRTKVFAILTGTALTWGMLFCPLQAAEVLKITPKSGTIEFVGFKDDGSHKGGFKNFSGSVTLAEDKLSSTGVVVEMETESLWSDNPGLTAHLINEDFFHIAKFPKAVFQSTALREVKPDERGRSGSKSATHVLSGKLTFLGVSQKIDLLVKVDLDDDAFSIKGTYNLDRTRFGMNYGIGKIHKDVLVEFSLKLSRK